MADGHTTILYGAAAGELADPLEVCADIHCGLCVHRGCEHRLGFCALGMGDQPHNYWQPLSLWARREREKQRAKRVMFAMELNALRSPVLWQGAQNG